MKIETAVCLVILSLLAMVVSHARGQATKPDIAIDPNAPRVSEIEAMLKEPAGLGKPITDRQAWDALAATPRYQHMVAAADRVVEAPMPSMPDDLFLEFSKTGIRVNYEAQIFAARANVGELVLAECAENEGRFLPKIKDYLDLYCGMRTWLLPAHDRNLANFNGTAHDIDLSDAESGLHLATAWWLLGDKLDATTREKLLANLRTRVVEPFYASATGAAPPQVWQSRTNNWNTVCHAGSLGVILAIEPDAHKRAVCIASAEKNVKYFLNSFGADGYCTEGLAYWDYGFGRFINLAEIIRQATHDGLDLMHRPSVMQIAEFGRRIEIMNGVSPAFADCSINARPAPQIERYMSARRPGAEISPPLSANSERTSLDDEMIQAFLDKSIPQLEAKADDSPDSPLRSWFDKTGILTARPAEESSCHMGVGLKGGSNGEQHNHNDIGSYVVVVDTTQVLLDPGREEYTARTFSSKRYDSKLLNSYGHPVPMVAGQLQRTGAQAKAVVLKSEFTDDVDTLQLDLTSGYDVPELKKLCRTFVYDRRGSGSLTVTDEVEFSSPQKFGTALITLGKDEKTDENTLRVVDGKKEVTVAIDTGGAKYTLNHDTIVERAPVKPLRIGIDLDEPVTTATVKMTIAVPTDK